MDNEGYGRNRGTRNTTDAVYGLRPVTELLLEQSRFENTITGAVAYGAPRRPGVDPIGFPWRYNPMYGRSDAPKTIGTHNIDHNHDHNVMNSLMDLQLVPISTLSLTRMVSKQGLHGT